MDKTTEKIEKALGIKNISVVIPILKILKWLKGKFKK